MTSPRATAAFAAVIISLLAIERAGLAQERPPVARFTTDILAGTGYGWSKGLADVNRDSDIARLPSLTDCGPTRDQTCVDTVAPQLLFFGWGAGVRVRLAAHLEAVLALENQLGVQADFLVDLFEGRGFEERTFNFDGNVGLAAGF